jgi:hypothetical protein
VAVAGTDVAVVALMVAEAFEVAVEVAAAEVGRADGFNEVIQTKQFKLKVDKKEQMHRYEWKVSKSKYL